MKKKKGKSKTHKSKSNTETNKVISIEKTMYELCIADLNSQVTRLEEQIGVLESKNSNLTEQLRTLNLEQAVVDGNLQQKLFARTDSLIILAEDILEVVKWRVQRTAEVEENMRKSKRKCESEKEKLIIELKLLNEKLNTLDEFRSQRDLLLTQLNDRTEEIRDKKLLYLKEVFEMKTQTQHEMDVLKKNVKVELMNSSDNFKRLTKVCSPDCTQRLVQENTTLRKEINRLYVMHKNLNLKFNKKKTSKVYEKFELIEKLKSNLIKHTENLIHIREFTTAYEMVQHNYHEALKYRKLYEINLRKTICKLFKITITNCRQPILKRRLKNFQLDKQFLINYYASLKHEVKDIYALLSNIKSGIFQIFNNSLSESSLKTQIQNKNLQESGTLVEKLMMTLSYEI